MLCLHPLQTFTGEPRAELLRDVPCAVTAHEERDLRLGEELARRLGMRPFRLADDQKTLYHLAAVVGCNLLVALESEAKRLMDEATGGEDGLRPPRAAPATTAMKNLLSSGDPAHALTGPVARGDVGTVRAHLRLLDRESPRLARTYRALSAGGAHAGGTAPRRRAGAHPQEPARRRRGPPAAPAGSRRRRYVIVARTVAETRAALRSLPRPLGFVPTMGALHDGHLSLVDAARSRCASVAGSVFVNPTQFGRGEDFDEYPRDEARDLSLLEEARRRPRLRPRADEMYAGRLRDHRARERAAHRDVRGRRRAPATSTASRSSSPSSSTSCGRTCSFSARRTPSSSPWCDASCATSTCRWRSSACPPCASPTAWP